MIEVVEGVFYDSTIKTFSEQSVEFQEYANEKYTAQVTDQVLSIGYPDFNKDGSITFNIDDILLRAEVTRIQRYPNSASNRSIREIIVEIFIK